MALMECTVIEHLFKDSNGDWLKENKTINGDGFTVTSDLDPFLLEIYFKVDGQCVAAIGYYDRQPIYVIGDYIADSIKHYEVTREQFMDFLFTNHQNIAEWLLWNLA